MAPTTISSKIIRSETRDTAKDAYLYAFAMMESYNTWYPQAADKTSPTYVGGFNTFRHYAQLFTPENHAVVTPNDTPYSWAWLDLRAEPIVVSRRPEGSLLRSVLRARCGTGFNGDGDVNHNREATVVPDDCLAA